MRKLLDALAAELKELERRDRHLQKREHRIALREDPDPWYTTEEAAEYLRTSHQAVLRRIARGKLTPDSWGGRGRGRHHMFRRSTLDAHLKGDGRAA